MKVLFVVWEIAPFFKVGGLGDVARALPSDLIRMGAEVAVVAPLYKATRFGAIKKTRVSAFKFSYAGRREEIEVYKVLHPLNNFPVFFLRNRTYLNVVNNKETWPFFDKVVVTAIKENIFSFKPDIIHCHDLHTGLIPLLIKEEGLNIKTMLTVHNLAHQGVVDRSVFGKMGIDVKKGKLLVWESAAKQVNMLMEGIIHSDIVTTVSPTYAREIMTEEYGMGLDEVLRGKEGRVFGILNGINITRYLKHEDGRICQFVQKRIESPEKIAADLSYYLEKKKERKRKLQKKLGLKTDERIPLSCFVGRFDPYQKGLDILHRMIRNLNLSDHQFVILGSGYVEWEHKFEWFNKFYPKNISCNFTFNEGLAHEIYEASDFILIPSKFEPCGLIQMIAMFFGTIPIARKTGGLIDSIKNNYNGFIFDSYTSIALTYAYKKAIDMWKNNRKAFEEMVLAALTSDFSWRKSAGEYLTLYKKLMEERI